MMPARKTPLKLAYFFFNHKSTKNPESLIMNVIYDCHKKFTAFNFNLPHYKSVIHLIKYPSPLIVLSCFYVKSHWVPAGTSLHIIEKKNVSSWPIITIKLKHCFWTLTRLEEALTISLDQWNKSKSKSKPGLVELAFNLLSKYGV